MKTKIVRSKLSEQQAAYLNLIAAELRATPGDVLLSLAFSAIESEVGNDGESKAAQWLASLRGFVDERKVPTIDPGEVNDYASGGRVAVEVPHA